MVLLSAAWSAMINVGNVLTPIAFGGGDPARIAFATNLANVFFGIGAFLTPLAIAFLLRTTSFARAVSLLGVLLEQFYWIASRIFELDLFAAWSQFGLGRPL